MLTYPQEKLSTDYPLFYQAVYTIDIHSTLWLIDLKKQHIIKLILPDKVSVDRCYAMY